MSKFKPIVEKTEAKDYWWCSCGKSANQPFCDGSHKGSEYTPKKVTMEDNKTVAWCTCKATSKPPFCDGTHSDL